MVVLTVNMVLAHVKKLKIHKIKINKDKLLFSTGVFGEKFHRINLHVIKSGKQSAVYNLAAPVASTKTLIFCKGQGWGSGEVEEGERTIILLVPHLPLVP
jgi:hypothetical protein